MRGEQCVEIVIAHVIGLIATVRLVQAVDVGNNLPEGMIFKLAGRPLKFGADRDQS